MTRKDIEEVRHLREEWKMWQDILSDLQADIALSPKVLDGMPYSKTNATSNPTQDKAIKLAEAAKTIEEKEKEIRQKIFLILEFITNIEDSEMRLIVGMRCVKCLTWEEIGNELKCDRTTASKKYYSFLDEKFPTIPT